MSVGNVNESVRALAVFWHFAYGAPKHLKLAFNRTKSIRLYIGLVDLSLQHSQRFSARQIDAPRLWHAIDNEMDEERKTTVAMAAAAIFALPLLKMDRRVCARVRPSPCMHGLYALIQLDLFATPRSPHSLSIHELASRDQCTRLST